MSILPVATTIGYGRYPSGTRMASLTPSWRRRSLLIQLPTNDRRLRLGVKRSDVSRLEIAAGEAAAHSAHALVVHAFELFDFAALEASFGFLKALQ